MKMFLALMMMVWTSFGVAGTKPDAIAPLDGLFMLHDSARGTDKPIVCSNKSLENQVWDKATLRMRTLIADIGIGQMAFRGYLEIVDHLDPRYGFSDARDKNLVRGMADKIFIRNLRDRHIEMTPEMSFWLDLVKENLDTNLSFPDFLLNALTVGTSKEYKGLGIPSDLLLYLSKCGGKINQSGTLNAALNTFAKQLVNQFKSSEYEAGRDPNSGSTWVSPVQRTNAQ